MKNTHQFPQKYMFLPEKFGNSRAKAERCMNPKALPNCLR